MSEALFEHIADVPNKKIRRLSQRQVERLLTPTDSTLTVSGLLWSLDLGAYALPGGDLVIGFEADRDVHEHDRWLFYTASPTSPWVTVEVEDRRSFRQIAQFGSTVDRIRSNVAPEHVAVDFVLLTALAGAVDQQKKFFRDEYGLEVASREILLASRLPGTLNPVYLREGSELSFLDAHDLLFHPENFYARYAQYKGLPLSYVQHLYGLDTTDVLAKPDMPQ